MSDTQLVVAIAFVLGALLCDIMARRGKLGCRHCASAIEAATAGETTKIGSTEGESAVAKPVAQTPPGDNK